MRKTFYFGYGSNLWREQMINRCPESKFLGIGRLEKYEWIISERGYANVVPDSQQPETRSPKQQTAPKHEVWGLIYSLSTSDEAGLDRNEGVPKSYQKVELDCEFWPANAGSCSVESEPEIKTLLVYESRDYVIKSKPKKEYIYRMNMGIKDAIKAGVPKHYIDKVLRQYIPDEEDETVKLVAAKQALQFEDER